VRVERGGWLYPLAGPLSVTSPITMCCASLVCLRRPAKKRTRLDDNIVVAAYGASLRQTPCSPCVAVPHTRSSPPLSFPVHDAAVLALGLLASNRFFRAARTSRASRRTPAPQAHSKDGEPTRQMRPQRWLETARRGAGMETHTPGSLQGECRAGERVQTPSRVAPPVGRHQLPQGSSTCYSLTQSSPCPLTTACVSRRQRHDHLSVGVQALHLISPDP